ncbi:unnamed protein product [Acanthoscelides obtectus]|uniref:Uncharacterized protein n=1 Tax=Acanthoscelides obtectus TaxID=200917 RepID=A0A9P0LKA2_ACAOB|nr:unnamed protein product [Acanthoscelides obtectus]CAK1673385.1 hypothetical protein AOBTE_LOCUS29319 [Acanthoscelides obtectus]
MDFLLSKYIHL